VLSRRTAHWLVRLGIAGVLVVPLGGCEELCNEGAITWCQDEDSIRSLNRAPEIGERIGVESHEPGTRQSPVSSGVGVVDLATTFRIGVFDRDNDRVLVEWDLDGDGEFEVSRTGGPLGGSSRIVEFYRRPTTPLIRVRVSDFPRKLGTPGDVRREQRVAIVERGGNRPPLAALTLSPAVARAGDPVILDGSSSTDPDFYDNQPFRPLFFRYTFGDRDVGNVASDLGLSEVSHTYEQPGTYTVGLSVDDAFGSHSAVFRTLTVQEAGAPNLLPTARFSVSPPAPAIGQQATFNGSASSDPEGPIARFQWDLDGDGSFEVNSGSNPTTSTSYAAPGEKLVSLRVTDARGASATVRRAVNVRSEPLPPLGASAAAAQKPRSRAAQIAFGAQLSGKPGRGEQGSVRRRGRTVSLRGAIGTGRLLARALDPPGRSTPAERSLRRFLNARWRTRISFTLDRRSRRLSARGVALARTPRGRRGSACLGVRLSGGPGRRSTGVLTLLGGTGTGARLRGRTRLRYRLEPSGSATVLGRLSARRGPARPLPRGCRRLTR
jgi:PKD domain